MFEDLHSNKELHLFDHSLNTCSFDRLSVDAGASGHVLVPKEIRPLAVSEAEPTVHFEQHVVLSH